MRAFGEPMVVEDVALAAPGPDEVRVRIGAVAVCGSDLHAAAGAWSYELPAVFGHEAAGVVAATGGDVTSVEPGDRVAVTLLRRCGACFYCAAGQPHLCVDIFGERGSTPLADASGAPIAKGINVAAFAEEVVVHHSQVVPIPDGIALDRACLLACGVITGYGAAVNTAGVAAGTTAVVIGCGGVGINCVQGAVAAGAAGVIAVDFSEAKLDLAARLGAARLHAPGDPLLRKEVLAATEGRGADYVFVAVGSPAAIEEGLGLARPGGTVVVVGMGANGSHARLDVGEFAGSAIRVIGSRMGSTDAARDIPALAARYLDGRLELDALVTATFPLDAINEAVAAARAGEAMRNVVVFPEVGE